MAYVVLITGSKRGIGAATARALHRDGAEVILHARSESQELADLAAELSAQTVLFDVTNTGEVDAAVASLLERNEQIHALVNSAGSVTPTPFLEMTDEHWLSELNVNLLGAVRVCRALAPHMTANEYGRIVNITSIRGEEQMASARIMGYSAAKAALANFTVSLAKELAPYVNVNAVSPGMTESYFTQFWTETVWEQGRSSLIGRVGQPQEVGELAAFLASERASVVNAQIITADGGYRVSGK